MILLMRLAWVKMMASKPGNSLLEAQKEWAYQKYWVMAHSQQHYNALRQLFKGNEWSEEKYELFKQLILEAQAISPSEKTLRVAYQHIWGYFKKQATSDELAIYKSLEASLATSSLEMLVFLKRLAEKYQVTYLLASRIIQKGL